MYADIICAVWIVCPKCNNRFQDVAGDLSKFSCPVCGSTSLIRVRTEDERSKEALAGMAAGAALGAAVGEVPGALIGGVIGFILGFFRTPTLEQPQK